MTNLHKFKLQDEIEVSYYQYGAEAGYPIIIHAGAIGHYKFSQSMQELLVFFDFTFYVINRPGFEGSGIPRSFSSMLDWPDIVKHFIKLKNINKFGVVGISGGSSYAYSLAYSWPESVKGVWILSGMPDIHLPGVLELFPQTFRDAIKSIQNKSTRQLQSETTIELLRLVQGLEMADADDDKSTITRQYYDLLNEQINNNSLGLVLGQKLLANQWGFSIRQISQTINVWHSKQDDEISFAPVEKMLTLSSNINYFEQKENAHDPSERTILQMLDNMQTILFD